MFDHERVAWRGLCPPRSCGGGLAIVASVDGGGGARRRGGGARRRGWGRASMGRGLRTLARSGFRSRGCRLRQERLLHVLDGEARLARAAEGGEEGRAHLAGGDVERLGGGADDDVHQVPRRVGRGRRRDLLFEAEALEGRRRRRPRASPRGRGRAGGRGAPGRGPGTAPGRRRASPSGSPCGARRRGTSRASPCVDRIFPPTRWTSIAWFRSSNRGHPGPLCLRTGARLRRVKRDRRQTGRRRRRPWRERLRSVRQPATGSAWTVPFMGWTETSRAPLSQDAA